MSPPAIVACIVGPGVLILEVKIIPIGTVRTHIGSRCVALRILVDALPVHPFIEGAAVVEHAVHDDADPPFMGFLHHLDKQFVAGLQICPVGHTVDISGCKTILLLSVLQQFAGILHDPADMRVYIVIVLTVIFVVGG